jgi:hypothetical protein
MQALNRKIFRVLLIVNMILVLTPAFFAIFLIVKKGRSIEPAVISIIIAFFLMGLNDLYNLFTINILKENSAAAALARKRNIALYVISLVVLALVFFFSCYGAYEEFSSNGSPVNTRSNIGKYIVLYLFFIILTGIVIAVLQAKFIRALSRIQKEEISELIENIGEPIPGADT